MRVTLDIPVNGITHGKLPINPKAFLYAIRLLQGSIFPPIKVEKQSGSYAIKDGRHRLAAHKLIGREVIKAHFGIPEDPRPHKELVCKDVEVKHNVPQADGYSLAEDKDFKRRTWLEE